MFFASRFAPLSTRKRVISRFPLSEEEMSAVQPLKKEIRKLNRNAWAGVGQRKKEAVVPAVGLENAARVCHNVVLHEFNVATPCCFDDVGFAHDARRRRSLRKTEGVRREGRGGGGGGEECGSCCGAAPAPARFAPESAAARVNENKHCGIWHKRDRTCNLPKWPDITREKQSAFQPDAVR